MLRRQKKTYLDNNKMVIALMVKVYVQNVIIIIEQVKAKIKGPIEKLFGLFFIWQMDGRRHSTINHTQN